MSTIAKIAIYFVVLGVLVVGTNEMPKSEKEFKGLVAFLALGWMVGGVFILFRTIFRFITR